MHPIFVTPFGPVAAYTLFVTLGFASAAAWVFLRHRAAGFTFDVTFTLTAIAAVAGLIGGRLLFVVTHASLFQRWWDVLPTAGFDARAGGTAGVATAILLLLFARSWLRRMRGAGATVLLSAGLIVGLVSARLAAAHALAPQSDPFDPAGGGMSVFGGFALAIPAVAFAVTSFRIPLLLAADAVAPGILFATALGRVGCVLNGCCLGQSTSVACAIQGRWPAALLEALLCALVGTFLALLPPRPTHGKIAGAACLGYATIRFALEFLRADTEPGLPGLTLNQSIALLMAALSVPLLARRAAPQPLPEPRPA